MKQFIDILIQLFFALVVTFVFFCVAFTIIELTNANEKKEQNNSVEYYEQLNIF